MIEYIIDETAYNSKWYDVNDDGYLCHSSGEPIKYVGFDVVVRSLRC